MAKLFREMLCKMTSNNLGESVSCQWALLVTSVCAVLVGCGSDSPYAPVSGVVTFDGKPIAEASVAFHPNGGGRPAYGLTRSDGTYVLTSVEQGDGALIGDHRVTITAVKMIESEKAKAMKEELGSLVDAMPIPPPKTVWLIPQSYSKPQTSGLEFTVESGKNSADFALTK